jgi:queuine tRNA-ribosyltransferase
MAGEILSLRLLTLHNIFFYLELMRAVRSHIRDGTFVTWKDETLAGLQAKGEEKSTLTT